MVVCFSSLRELVHRSNSCSPFQPHRRGAEPSESADPRTALSGFKFRLFHFNLSESQLSNGANNSNNSLFKAVMRIKWVYVKVFKAVWGQNETLSKWLLLLSLLCIFFIITTICILTSGAYSSYRKLFILPQMQLRPRECKKLNQLPYVRSDI